MQPGDITLIASIGRPVVLPDGSVLAAVGRPDLEKNRTSAALHRFHRDAAAAPFTTGDRDSGPVVAPDGRSVVFLRPGEKGSTTLCLIPVDGGEARVVATHPGSVDAPVFTPDGAGLVYTAAVPEPGRYGTDPDIDADAEAPRRITRLDFHADGRGYLYDQAPQVFVVALDDHSAEPVRLTAEPGGAGQAVVSADGQWVRYVRGVGPDQIGEEIAQVALGSAEPTVGELLLQPGGSVNSLTAHETGLLFLSVVADDPSDFAGRTCGLFHWDAANGWLVRLTDPDTVDTDPSAGAPVLIGDQVLVAVQHRGRVELRAVPTTADSTALADLPVIIGGEVAVRGFAHRDGVVAAVVADPTTPGEIVLTDVAGTEPARITDLGAAVRERGLARQLEITATATDGYPVHGFLMLPPTGDGPFPVLLDIHGGPHAAYTWSWFDEAQLYANAGYAVVLPNPRGSAGYTQAHGRAVRKAMGRVDVDDILSLLDAVGQRPDCDGDRVGVMGGSYGGFMTTLLAGRYGDRFTAAISERAVNAWDSFVGSSDIGWFFPDNYVGSSREELWAASPLATADGIDIPFLIIHSEQDWRCPVEQAHRLFVLLKKNDVDVEMLLFPGEGHELSRSGRPRHRVQRFEAILDWWSRHLPV